MTAKYKQASSTQYYMTEEEVLQLANDFKEVYVPGIENVRQLSLPILDCDVGDKWS